MNLLFSYHYLRGRKDADLAVALQAVQGPVESVYIDSGGFSAHTQGVAIDLEEYCGWLLQHRENFTAAFALDVIGDPAGTFENTLRMANDLGIDRSWLIPIVHFPHRAEWVERYRDEGFHLIALGGMVRRPRAEVTPWCRSILHRFVPEGVEFHGLGIGGGGECVQLPWYSVDASNPSAGMRWAYRVMWDELRGVPTGERTVGYGSWARGGASRAAAGVFAARDQRWMRQIGVDPIAVIDPASRGLTEAEALFALWHAIATAWEQAQRRRYGPRLVPGLPDGPRMFAAALPWGGDRPTHRERIAA